MKEIISRLTRWTIIISFSIAHCSFAENSQSDELFEHSATYAFSLKDFEPKAAKTDDGKPTRTMPHIAAEPSYPIEFLGNILTLNEQHHHSYRDFLDSTHGEILEVLNDREAVLSKK